MSLSWEIRGAGMKTLAESSWRVEDKDSWEDSSFCFLQDGEKLTPPWKCQSYDINEKKHNTTVTIE